MHILFRSALRNFCRLIIILFIALPLFLLMRGISPFFLVRVGSLISARLGHFAANTELYLCERDKRINVPSRPYIDLFYFADKEICNKQLAKMWRRQLRIGPRWLLAAIARLNKLRLGWQDHIVPIDMSGLDTKNLLDQTNKHLSFTQDEELLGERTLEAMQIPKNSKFICLNVRDSAYLAAHFPVGNWESHDYRDSDVQHYSLAAETLAARGYIVIRMGAAVHNKFISDDPNVIDYATNGMRSDFMDIYLASKCFFAISTGSGWDSLPEVFRRPIVYTNFSPIGAMHTFRAEFLTIPKRLYSDELDRELTLREIFSIGVDLCTNSRGYTERNIRLIQNTPEEIRDAAIEMADRLEGRWTESAVDEKLQLQFWSLFRALAIRAHTGSPFHGELHSRFGACFLRQNQNWLV